MPRVSTGRQADSDLSIPDQRRQAKGYCASRGWEIVADYVEPGVSATDDRRPEFQRMVDAATTKPPAFDVILVHSFSRFFRDQFQLEFYVRRLAKNGVRLASITQELGDDPMSNMIRQIMALFDEYQSRENAKHTLRAMKENARQGFWNGALPPIGYRIVEARRAARPPRQEDPGDRPDPGRVRAADLPPGARGRRQLRSDGRQVDHQAPERRRHPHARRWALGDRRRAQGAHPHDLHRSTSVQHQALEDARTEARGRGGRDGCAAQRLYDAIENGIADVSDRMLKERVTELRAVRDQARADAERAEGALDRLGPSITPQTLKTFARQARKGMRVEGGGYRRDHLRALAQRIEVDAKELEKRAPAHARRRLKCKIGNVWSAQFCTEVARPEGFEPPTPRFVVCR